MVRQHDEDSDVALLLLWALAVAAILAILV